MRKSNIKDNTKKTNYFKLLLFSMVVVLICCFFISQKKDLYIDELFTYGLANNSFQLDIDDYTKYSGEELLLKYTSVKEGQLFNAKNVFENQQFDTHPPLYYLLVNFICSFNPNKFSLWYGLIINIILMAILFWELSYLLNKVINNELFSNFIVLISFLNYGFVNEAVLTRMYVMLSCISLLFIILVINKIERLAGDGEKIDMQFLLAFFVICITGILTQYHFMIIAGIFSIILGVSCIYHKKFKMLLGSVFAGVCSIFVSYIIFPKMKDHILGTKTSIHSLTTASNSTAFTRGIEFLKSIQKGFFGHSFIFYLAALFILIVLFLAINRKNKISLYEIIVKNKLYFTIFASCIIYFLIITFTSNYDFERYMYNIYPLVLIIIASPMYLILKNIKRVGSFLALLMIFGISISSIISASPTFLYHNTTAAIEFIHNNRNVKMVLVYSSDEEHKKLKTVVPVSYEDRQLNNGIANNFWKLPVNLYLFKEMKNMTYVNSANYDSFLNITDKNISDNNDLFVVIFTHVNDEYAINRLMEINNVTNVSRIFFTDYMHMYRLTE
jgi:hypothetical protein